MSNTVSVVLCIGLPGKAGISIFEDFSHFPSCARFWVAKMDFGNVTGWDVVGEFSH